MLPPPSLPDVVVRRVRWFAVQGIRLFADAVGGAAVNRPARHIPGPKMASRRSGSVRIAGLSVLVASLVVFRNHVVFTRFLELLGKLFLPKGLGGLSALSQHWFSAAGFAFRLARRSGARTAVAGNGVLQASQQLSW